MYYNKLKQLNEIGGKLSRKEIRNTKLYTNTGKGGKEQEKTMSNPLIVRYSYQPVNSIHFGLCICTGDSRNGMKRSEW
ncbi:hypothetical protein BLOT_003398 [Blomia tropicalis]|nr:hypothetical protein BLOT_003398 [Blomia tropicalis]